MDVQIAAFTRNFRPNLAAAAAQTSPSLQTVFQLGERDGKKGLDGWLVVTLRSASRASLSPSLRPQGEK